MERSSLIWKKLWVAVPRSLHTMSAKCRELVKDCGEGVVSDCLPCVPGSITGHGRAGEGTLLAQRWMLSAMLLAIDEAMWLHMVHCGTFFPLWFVVMSTNRIVLKTSCRASKHAVRRSIFNNVQENMTICLLRIRLRY